MNHPFRSVADKAEPSINDQVAAHGLPLGTVSIGPVVPTICPVRITEQAHTCEGLNDLVLFPPKMPITGVSDLRAGFTALNCQDELPASVTSSGNFCSHGRNASQNQNTHASRNPLKGGRYTEPEALSLINSWFVIAQAGGASLIAQVGNDGSLSYITPRDFSIRVRNITVTRRDKHSGYKIIPAEKFWLEHPLRHECSVIFEPTLPPGNAVQGNYNLWRGFAISRASGRLKQRRLHRHIWIVICRRDRVKFRYLMRWLAWSVQHPDRAPGTVVVLKSRTQGTGKSTLSYVMRDLFGKHARVFDNKDRLFGRFNADLETVCFACAEEMLWAGDRGAADALKSLITGDTLTLEIKNGARWDVPNRLHILMTTNHEHAVQAGVQDRRFFVLDVSAEKAQDPRWFGPLYEDLSMGGREQFLNFLANLKLGSWHPRDLPKTADNVAQQRMSADTVARWIQSCIDDDSVVGMPNGMSLGLQTTITTENLRTAYAGYCAQNRMFPVAENIFGKAMTAMLGESIRLAPAPGNGRRPRAYKVLDATELQQRLDAYLGVSKN